MIDSPTVPRILHRIAGWSLFGVVVIAALAAGLILRRWAWDQTEPIRYTTDINNAFAQGTMALQTGYFNRYDEQETARERETFMSLDYGPGRLAVAYLWTLWVHVQLDPQLNHQPGGAHHDSGTFQQLREMWNFLQSPVPPKLPRLPETFFYAHARAIHSQYDLVKPLLLFNLTGEILSAIAMFFIVRRYTSGKAPPDAPLHRPVKGTILGLVAVLFFWFDPALISNAHCWPQWDSWVLPFFLWAILLASLNFWFCAGALIGIGAMFKGQILFGAPVFLLWPLFQGRLPAVARWIIGLLFAVALITSPWLLRIPGTNPTGEKFIPGSLNPHAVEWVIYLALIFTCLTVLLWWPKHPRARIPVAMVIATILTWLFCDHLSTAATLIGFALLAGTAWLVDDRMNKWSWHARLPLAWLVVALLIYPLWILTKDWPVALIIVIVGALAVAALLLTAPKRALPYTAAAWIAVALLLCIPVFGASKGWFDLGIAFGTHHYERMASGTLNNLPELLQNDWGWHNLMEPAFTIPKGATADQVASFLTAVDPGVKLEPGKPVGLPLKYFLVGIWLIAVVLCAAGAAYHDHRRSPRFLIAIAAPWIMFFAVMTQMHQRYLLWGASLSSAAVVMGPGYALLHLLVSSISVSQELQSMMNNPLDPSHPVNYTGVGIYRFIEAWHPGIGWVVILISLIFVYGALKRERKKTLSVGKIP